VLVRDRDGIEIAHVYARQTNMLSATVHDGQLGGRQVISGEMRVLPGSLQVAVRSGAYPCRATGSLPPPAVDVALIGTQVGEACLTDMLSYS
jgi:hypothetical protein